ncbi:putative disease resistance RPP13-like protein 1 [Coffea eugenioides]|uniref:putative disease resistance RPP13-like protein 1 n=1 Tax=Coffea eugenioides TaxID=49369 RepID=UPI000F60F0B2|nr:putative disease resistance RPP13-like protein 1 [Coffea eugenioides]
MDAAAISFGSSALSAFLQVALDRVASREFLNLFGERKHDDKILNKLKRNLWLAQAVLNDAESKQAGYDEKWMDELQDAVYDADDLLDQISTEALKVRVEHEQKSMINQVSTCTSYLSNEFLQDITPKIAELVDLLEELVQKLKILGTVKIEVNKQSRRDCSISSIDENGVYGRDDDKEKMIKILLCDDRRGKGNTVIPIVGMGGIGKTTVAQLVCNDKRVKVHFDVIAWVCVSEEHDVIKITKSLLEGLGSLCESMETLSSLQVKLQQSLIGKKFLFVLDDVWNSSYSDWEMLKSPFSSGKQGSKIIVTTRDERVALMIRNGPIHFLDLISDEDCWSLFEKHAFRNEDSMRNQELEVIGKEIVKKCKGLPLAAKVAGGLLGSKGTFKEWEDIFNSDEWCQSNSKDGILPALRLSYIHMHSHLKRCFAYCALFHKDYKFKKEELILLWMANDLLEHPGNNKRIEDVGDEYFCELRQRAFFQKSSDDSFYMHDLINDLANSVSGKYYVRLEDHHQQQSLVNKVRHFSYTCGFWDVYEKFKQLRQATHLRTFLPIRKDKLYIRPISKNFLHEIVPNLSSLRVLSLAGYSLPYLPDSIQRLKQLRLLNLSLTNIENLPDWVCTFYNLQTLLLSDCKNLEELPDDMGKLINLRHLDITGTPLKKLPAQIGELKCLQVLTTFVCNKDPGLMIEDLGKLCNLRGKLTVSGLENAGNGLDATLANMKGKKHLEDLSLEWNGTADDSQEAIDILQKLQPSSRIKRLEVKGYGGTRFPDWLADQSFHNVVSVILSRCSNCFCLPALGQLPSLKFLTIADMGKISIIDMQFYGNGSVFEIFQSLQILRIEEMPEWKDWLVPRKGVFCGLQELHIINCPKLVGDLPKQLLSVREFELSGCPGLVLSDGRFSMFNSLDLYSLKILKISNMPSLEDFTSELKKLTGLEDFEIGNCPRLTSIWSMPLDMGRLPASLKTLKISGCPQLQFLPKDCFFGSLEQLRIREAGAGDTLKDLSLGLLQKIRDLEIQDCEGLESLSFEHGSENLASLGSILLWGCGNLRSFLQEGLPAANLTWIMLYGCKKLKLLPKGMRSLLPSLRLLYMWNCPEIECFPEEGLPFSLETLEIYNCEILMSRRREWNLQTLPSLRELMIGETHQQLFPEDWLLPSTLRVLRIYFLHNLEALNYKSLKQLISLETLCIWGCHHLQSLPKEGLPRSLSQLIVYDCPLLKPHLDCATGQDWRKVAHISCLMVDGEFVP